MNVLVQGGPADALTQRVANIPYLSILPSGPFTPNSSELLRLPATTNLLTEFRETYDFVIIDGAPLLPVADAQVLLDNPLIDVILLVARPNLTTREQIRLVAGHHQAPSRQGCRPRDQWRARAGSRLLRLRR